MGTIRKNWWKILLIALVGTFAAFGLHQVIPTSASMSGPFSALVETVGFPTVIGGYFVVAFGLILTSFALLQKHLSGTRLAKGLRYGAAIGIIWYVGLLETSSLLGTPLIDEAVMAVADITPIVLMCATLAMWTGTDTPATPTRKPGGWAIPMIAVCFSVGRFFAYTVANIESGFTARTAETLVWTAAMGLAVGAVYRLLASDFTSFSQKSSLLWFGLLFFGLNWWIFNLFGPIVWGGSIIAFTVRVGIDVLFVLIGIFFSEKLYKCLPSHVYDFSAQN